MNNMQNNNDLSATPALLALDALLTKNNTFGGGRSHYNVRSIRGQFMRDTHRPGVIKCRPAVAISEQEADEMLDFASHLGRR